MFSLKQKWKALGQKAIVKPTEEDITNSASVSNTSVKPSSQQRPSVYQYSLNESFEADFEVGDDDAEQFRIPVNTPSPSVSSLSNHSAVRQSPTKPIDIKYFVPKNVEPEGLSQSVMISDHDYIHRHLVQRYKMNEDIESISQRTLLHQDTIQESSNEDLDYLSIDDDHNEEDSISVAAAIANTLFSKSVPLLSSMSNYPRFAWSTITPPGQEYSTKSKIHSPSLSIKEDINSSESELQMHEGEIETSLDRDHDESVEEAKSTEEEDDLKEWTEAADECYGEVIVKDKELFDSRLCAANLETPWDRAHKNEYALERLKNNEFIHILFKRHSVPMKVTNVAQNARFKQIQHRLHNPNILYIRYMRNTQTLFVIFRRYTEMMRAVDTLNCIAISGKTIVCRPSSYAEYDEAYKDELKRKIRHKKIKAAKKGNRNKKVKKSKSKNQKVTALGSAITKVNAKQQQTSKKRKKQKGPNNGGNNYGRPSSVYYYPYYYQY